MRRLRIITLNTQGIRLPNPLFWLQCRALIKQITAEPIDVLVLQEVFFYPHLWYLRYALKPVLPYSVYQANWAGPKAGLVTFSSQPLTPTHYQTFSQLGSWFDRTIVSRLGRKGVLACRHAAAGTTIINVHCSPNFLADWDKPNRDSRIQSSQVDEIRRFIMTRRESWVMAGDFNIQRGSRLYKQLVKRPIFDRTEAGVQTHYGDRLLAKTDHLQVDYVMTDRSLPMKPTELRYQHPIKLLGFLYRRVSDHAGIYAELKIGHDS